MAAFAPPPPLTTPRPLRPAAPSIAELGLAFAASAGATALLPLRTGVLSTAHPLFPNPWDHQKYLHMAAHQPGDFHIAPFCWRIGGPWLARALSVDLQVSFFLITFVSIALTGAALYALARALGFSRVMGAAGTAMFFSLAWGPKFALWDFWLPDGASFLLATVAIFAVVTSRDLLFAAVLTLGVTVKESVLFTGPLLYSLRATKPIDVRLAARCLVCMLPAALVGLSLRLAIPQRNMDRAYWSSIPATVVNPSDFAPYDLAWLLATLGRQRAQTFSVDVLGAFTFGTYGVLLIALPFFALARNASLFARFLPFLALVYAQVLFASNTERLLVAGFPAVILLSLNGLDRIASFRDVEPVALLPLPLAFVALNVLHAPLGQPPTAIQWLVLVGYLAVLVCLPRRALAPGRG